MTKLKLVDKDNEVSIKIPTLEGYRALLEAHDWHYEMSDDMSVWSSGNKSYKQLLDYAALDNELDRMLDEYETKHMRTKGE